MATNNVSNIVPLVTPEELAGMLTLSLRTLDDWRYRGTGPRWIRMGKHVRYRMSAIEEWLNALESPAA